MKIGEARSAYSTQIRAYDQKKMEIQKQKQELEQRIRTTENGAVVFQNEAATLELQYTALNEKQQEYRDYMDQLLEQWSAVANMESSKQQGDAMKEQAAELGKILEVARRIMHGDRVPAKDEKKLMEFDHKLYMMAKNAAMMVERLEKERKKHKSLWEDEEKKEYPDPMEVADGTEAFAGGPDMMSVEETLESVSAEGAVV